MYGLLDVNFMYSNWNFLFNVKPSVGYDYYELSHPMANNDFSIIGEFWVIVDNQTTNFLITTFSIHISWMPLIKNMNGNVRNIENQKNRIFHVAQKHRCKKPHEIVQQSSSQCTFPEILGFYTFQLLLFPFFFFLTTGKISKTVSIWEWRRKRKERWWWNFSSANAKDSEMKENLESERSGRLFVE